MQGNIVILVVFGGAPSAIASMTTRSFDVFHSSARLIDAARAAEPAFVAA